MNFDSIPENDPFRNVWCYDIEVFTNCFTMTAVNMVNPENKKTFIIWKDINQSIELIKFVKSCYGMIGYNNLGFDYPIIHLCLLIRPTAAAKQSGDALARFIFRKTQEIIHMERPMYVRPIVPQRDVYRIWHFDNEAKATSLKWVQCAIRWPIVEETPYSFMQEIEDERMLENVLRYNLNDVLSTRQFYLDKTMNKVKMRKVLSQKFNLRLENANDAKIGEMIVLSGVAKEKDMDIYQLKELCIPRTQVRLSQVILPHIRFKSKEFNHVLDRFKSMVITDTSGKDELVVLFDDMAYYFGMGGIHAARTSSKSKKKGGKSKSKNVVTGGEVFYDVNSCDVTSYYPSLAISWRFFPSHLGDEFVKVYTSIYNERRKYPKGTPENEGLKLALNAVFGKSNSEHSALNDMHMFLQITINGQLLLAMLCEELTLSGAARVIMANTDGIEVQIKNQSLYEEICKRWEETNKLKLEYSHYKVIAIRDVNNYIAVKDDGKTKEKGAYEVDKEIHKDPSMRVVALAVREHLTKGTPVSEFINNHQDMWDFMMYVRAKTGEFRLRWIDLETSELMDAPVVKTLRYYISAKSGDVLMKKTEKKFEKVHQNAYVVICNDVEHPNFQIMPQMLDRQFYIREAAKLLHSVYAKPKSIFA